MNKKLISSVAIALAFGAAAQAQVVLYSNSGTVNGPGGTTTIADPFGTGMGDIIAVDADGLGQYSNFNTGFFDMTAYNGQELTLQYDIYFDGAGVNGAYTSDDQSYMGINIGGGGGAAGSANWRTVSNASSLNQWETVTLTVTVDSSLGDGTYGGLMLTNNRATAGNAGIPSHYIDNISFTVVPEPGTYALMAGALALGAVMVRRRRS
ncbi:PEP-CTERM sorting domain-containing protein [Coraliomargarita akajimensis]|nr:PEP-CTERM sorting domain-containing protein [Coraliomargarita akajimensis]